MGVFSGEMTRGGIGETTRNDATSEKGNGDYGSGGSGDSKGAHGRGVRRVGGRRLGRGGSGKVRDGHFGIVFHGEGKEGGDFGQEEGFFVGGDGTVEEDGEGSADDLAVGSGGGGGARVWNEETVSVSVCSIGRE